ncbi:hypothetical protein BGZ74_002552, partial [Mortierella antarctica]
MLFKSTSLVLFVLAASLVSATPVTGDYGGLNSDYCPTGDCSTTVPVAPVSIIPETDFIPINNVLPIVNVLPVDVNDYSFLNYNLYGNYGYGIGGLGGLGLGGIGGLGGLG